MHVSVVILLSVYNVKNMKIDVSNVRAGKEDAVIADNLERSY